MSGGFRTLDLRGVPISAEAVAPAVAHLREGGVLLYPTETVYGIGAVADPEGVAAVAALKGREPDKPFIVLVDGPDRVAGLHWSDEARELARIFWPGAVTLVLPDPSGIFPPGVRSAAGSVAVRVSPHAVVRSLMERLDRPLLSTSANAAGGPPARSGAEAAEVAAALGAGPGVLVIDAGALPPSEPSTVVDCSGPAPVVLREGSVPVGRLRCVLPEIHGRTSV